MCVQCTSYNAINRLLDLLDLLKNMSQNTTLFTASGKKDNK